MKNRTSLFVLAVEILAIVLLHTLKASANDPSNISAKEIPPVKADVASKDSRDLRHHFLLTALK
jgi:hypothetical protein